MPRNPFCTIGGGALQHYNKFQLVQHDMNSRIVLKDKLGTQKIFEGDNLLKINGLDYIPVTTIPHDCISNHLQCQVSTA